MARIGIWAAMLSAVQCLGDVRNFQVSRGNSSMEVTFWMLLNFPLPLARVVTACVYHVTL